MMAAVISYGQMLVKLIKPKLRKCAGVLQHHIFTKTLITNRQPKTP